MAPLASVCLEPLLQTQFKGGPLYPAQPPTPYAARAVTPPRRAIALAIRTLFR
jgi:hypothetical protein